MKKKNRRIKEQNQEQNELVLRPTKAKKRKITIQVIFKFPINDFTKTNTLFFIISLT